MFKDSKNFVNEIQQKLRDTTTENERVRHELNRLHVKTNQVADYERELQIIEKERDDIERSIKSILAEPFRNKKDATTIEA